MHNRSCINDEKGGRGVTNKERIALGPSGFLLNSYVLFPSDGLLRGN